MDFKLYPEQRYAHHRKALRAVLEDMLARDFTIDECLDNTGLTELDIDNDKLKLSLEQEYNFYRNILGLRRSSTIGLELGKLFSFETYGLLGYALLSSATIADAIQTATDFAPLTFSHFNISKVEQGSLSGIAFAPQLELPDDLIQLYSDRDISASLTGMLSMIPQGIELERVKLVHEDRSNRRPYEKFFNCEVEFGCKRNELLVTKEHIEKPLPRRDQEATVYCRQQCQQLLDRLGDTQATADKVRSLLVAEPGHFPNLEDVAGELKLGVRTLRRMLRREDTSFQEILQEIRQELAEEYLQTNMSLEAIADRLGYSEAANFSHAFKRWSGVSPRAFRQATKSQL